jgi:hypothetical protein
MALAKRNDVPQAFLLDGSHEPFGVCILNRRASQLQAQVVEGAAKARVAPRRVGARHGQQLLDSVAKRGRPGPRRPAVPSYLVGGLYHFGRSVSDLARACRLMGEGAYDRLHAPTADGASLTRVGGAQARRVRECWVIARGWRRPAKLACRRR